MDESHDLGINCGSASIKMSCELLATILYNEQPPRDQAQPQFEKQLWLRLPPFIKRLK